jgi:hypothetical protein
VEKVTLQTLKDIEMLSDTKGAYLFDLAEKLHIFRAGPAQVKPILVSVAEAGRILR